MGIALSPWTLDDEPGIPFVSSSSWTWRGMSTHVSPRIHATPTARRGREARPRRRRRRRQGLAGRRPAGLRRHLAGPPASPLSPHRVRGGGSTTSNPSPPPRPALVRRCRPRQSLHRTVCPPAS